MRFEELSKEHQEFFMYCLSIYIKNKVKDRDEVIDPTYEEYKAFFDEFDGEYEIVDGLPESETCKKFLINSRLYYKLKDNN